MASSHHSAATEPTPSYDYKRLEEYERFKEQHFPSRVAHTSTGSSNAAQRLTTGNLGTSSFNPEKLSAGDPRMAKIHTISSSQVTVDGDAVGFPSRKLCLDLTRTHHNPNEPTGRENGSSFKDLDKIKKYLEDVRQGIVQPYNGPLLFLTEEKHGIFRMYRGQKKLVLDRKEYYEAFVWAHCHGELNGRHNSGNRTYIELDLFWGPTISLVYALVRACPCYTTKKAVAPRRLLKGPEKESQAPAERAIGPETERKRKAEAMPADNYAMKRGQEGLQSEASLPNLPPDFAGMPYGHPSFAQHPTLVAQQPNMPWPQQYQASLEPYGPTSLETIISRPMAPFIDPLPPWTSNASGTVAEQYPSLTAPFIDPLPQWTFNASATVVEQYTFYEGTISHAFSIPDLSSAVPVRPVITAPDYMVQSDNPAGQPPLMAAEKYPVSMGTTGYAFFQPDLWSAAPVRSAITAPGYMVYSDNPAGQPPLMAYQGGGSNALLLQNATALEDSWEDTLLFPDYSAAGGTR